MSDNTPEAPAPAPTPEAPAVEPQAAQQTPPWGDNFDADKAWNLIQNLRSDKEKLSAREVLTPDAKQKLAEYDRLVEASKSELEKAQEAAGKVQPLEAENLRLKVALEKGLTGDKASLVDRLKGDTFEAMCADADSLLSLLSAGPTTQVPKPNPAQGASGSGPAQAAQLSRDDLARMTPEQIVDARNAGRLNDLLGITEV